MDAFDRWLESLETRHLQDLRFPEVSRALRALSATYVESRGRLASGAALGGAGKRAAFALFYGPLHFLTVREVTRVLPGAVDVGPRLVDLGSGTGAAGAAWASAAPRAPAVVAIDRHPWALQESAWTYAGFGLAVRTVRADLTRIELPKGPATFLAAFTLNELPEVSRDALLERLLARAATGDAVLVVEPIAGFVAPWWKTWRPRVEAAGGRSDEWRFRIDLPAIVQKLDRAAGMNHRELTCRTLYLGR